MISFPQSWLTVSAGIVLVSSRGSRVNTTHSRLGPGLPSGEVSALRMQGSFSEGGNLLTTSVSFVTERSTVGWGTFPASFLFTELI